MDVKHFIEKLGLQEIFLLIAKITPFIIILLELIFKMKKSTIEKMRIQLLKGRKMDIFS